MEYLIFYLVVVMVEVDVEASICCALGMEFKLPAALIGSLFWPITVPAGIVVMFFSCRKNKGNDYG